MFIRNLSLIVIVLMASWSINAQATGNHNQNGPSCTGNSCNTYEDNSTSTTNQGGQGGLGVGVGIGIGQGGNGGAGGQGGTGGSVKSDIDVKNNQTQGQGQLQGQQQGQLQGQAQSTDNANNSKQKVDVNVEGDSYEAPEIPVATAIGPSMSPSGQCMGVATGGIQGMNIGISMGKSYESKPCNQRELARMFYLTGQTKASVQVLCSIEGAEVTDLCKNKEEPLVEAKINSKVELVPAKFMGVSY